MTWGRACPAQEMRGPASGDGDGASPSVDLRFADLARLSFRNVYLGVSMASIELNPHRWLHKDFPTQPTENCYSKVQHLA